MGVTDLVSPPQGSQETPFLVHFLTLWLSNERFLAHICIFRKKKWRRNQSVEFFFIINFIFRFFNDQGVNIPWRDIHLQKNLWVKFFWKISQSCINVFVTHSMNKKWGSPISFGVHWRIHVSELLRAYPRHKHFYMLSMPGYLLEIR